MAKEKQKTKAVKPKEKGPLPFTRRNWTWMGIGILVIIIGFVALSMGSTTLAPILLVLGYCVIIPISILLGEKKKEEKPPKTEELERKEGLKV
ncbi:MAG: hypothetical protein OEV55_07485 [candidate division Zixibacteria bacterium]|nr:hypothetical protein [candidate division Zixibacteria bacterium]